MIGSKAIYNINDEYIKKYSKYLITSLLLVFIAINLYGQNESSSHPNILFIMVDDLRPELGCYGQEQIKSPNMDRLAKRGQLFTRAYVNYPVCGPSRASILSGLYPSRVRFNAWNCSQDKEVPGIISLPMHFRNNNYKTISLGKIYNNFEDGKGSWDVNWRPATTTTTWDYQSQEGIKIFENQNLDRHSDTRPRNNTNLPKRGPAFERGKVNDIAYRDGKIANKAIQELQELQQKLPQPFFLAVGFHKPHLPFNAPVKYWDLYDRNTIRLPENMYQPKGAPDESMHNYGELRAYYNIPDEKPISDNLAKELIHGYYACVSYVDAQIGRVLNALEDLGLEKNTIVVLWGDHGWQLGEHDLWCKHANFSTSLKIPLIIKVPGQKTGIQRDGLVESVDIYPTLCDLAELSTPFHLQGKSFKSILVGSDLDGKKYVYGRSNLNGETIISKTHTYTEFFDNKSRLISKMLYDLRSDPEENINKATVLSNNELINIFSNKLKEHIENRDRILLH